MPEFNSAITISAFIAGLLTFFAPCTLPLIPAFLGIISGAKIEDLKDDEKIKTLRWLVFKNALGYVIGFSAVFIIFGAVFSYAGTIGIVREWMEKFGGLFLISFGLFLIGWLKIPVLNYERQVRVPQLFRNVSVLNSFILGSLFAFGWSPCVGPLLGSILLLASTAGTLGQGVFLLVVFSAGLGLPFLVTALLIGKAFTLFNKLNRTIVVVNRISGAFLIFIGFMFITDNFSRVMGLFRIYFYNYQFFEVFINKFL